ncbi:insulin-like 5b [Chanos chanos]|uniref:Insulin-like 5b n=1 Tax=Chanos chanos TaxID=29144 RepID=A0A6J2VCS6_CHACN|nr:relaxin-like [Chanos chanos]
MRFLLLAVLLVSALLSGSVQPAGTVSALKLCGREFVRAVVYTCGGSRWRRIPSDDNAEDYQDQTGLDILTSKTGMDLTRRDLNDMLTIVCCQVGCRNSDLARLC